MLWIIFGVVLVIGAISVFGDDEKNFKQDIFSKTLAIFGGLVGLDFIFTGIVNWW